MTKQDRMAIPPEEMDRLTTILEEQARLVKLLTGAESCVIIAAVPDAKIETRVHTVQVIQWNDRLHLPTILRALADISDARPSGSG